MAQTVQLGSGGKGKIRSFWAGFGLNIITLGIYYWYWYFQINDELKEIGRSQGDPELAESKPINSLLAVLLGGYLLAIPALISIYRTGKRIKHAERLVGVKDCLHPTFSFLLVFPFGILIIPALYQFAYVTKHQNRALMAASGARV
jgi:hypothetical protein